MPTVNLNDLEDAVTLVGDDWGEAEAWVSRDTGEVLLRTECDPPGAPPLPDDIAESDRYIEVPGSRDLDLGTPLVFRFVERDMPRDYDAVREMFHKKGAYRRFSDLVDRRNLRDKWHRFRDDETKAALRAWCAEHGLATK
ncbi:hypothetical protein GCM10027321_18400 [Massilia terrae]|uniref:Uncharacterized protein n=1 Tax=Massilia terrae TaxID=1811224 RepID=A0ABT2CWG1_9BURK|nr:hypothetical protein [Massilia terrae]MCS0658301.1 hypothetical protein [Massilia terrae]